jgi:hypothetical protein
MRQLTKQSHCIRTKLVTDDGRTLDTPLRCPFAWNGQEPACGEFCACYDEYFEWPPAGDGKTYVHCAAAYNRVLGVLEE